MLISRTLNLVNLSMSQTKSHFLPGVALIEHCNLTSPLPAPRSNYVFVSLGDRDCTL